jgi:serine/threonine protein kinase
MDANSSSTIAVDNLIPLAVGAQLQEFVVERVIGIGGFGIVYQAYDTLLRRTVAIKEYMPTSMAARGDGATVSLRSSSHSQDFEAGKVGFIDEARMLAQFKHAALIEVFRFWEQNSTAYMATPFYEGRTLKQRLRDSPGVPDEMTLKKVLLPVLDALEHMHAAQVYHRDISPDNIMVLEDGKPILLDLGAARRLETENAQALTVLVKPGYAPIEQYAGDAGVQQGPWTDIYGWGASAYFALTGKPPPPSASRIMSDSIVKLVDAKITAYSYEFLAAIDAALAVRPDDRPQSIAALKSMFALELPVAEPERLEQIEAMVEVEKSIQSQPVKGSVKEPLAKEQVAPDNKPKSGTGKSTLVAGLVACFVGLGATFWWFSQPTKEQSAKVEKPISTVPPVAVEPTKSAPVNSELVKIEPEKIEPVKIETAKVEPAKVEAAKVEAAKVEAAKAEPTTVQTPPAEAGTREVVPVDKPAVARLSIKPWGEVYVNGESRGVSPPLKALTLKPGDYKIEIRNGDYPARNLTIKLKSGEVFKLNHAFVDAAQK